MNKELYESIEKNWAEFVNEATVLSELTNIRDVLDNYTELTNKNAIKQGFTTKIYKYSPNTDRSVFAKYDIGNKMLIVAFTIRLKSGLRNSLDIHAWLEPKAPSKIFIDYLRKKSPDMSQTKPWKDKTFSLESGYGESDKHEIGVQRLKLKNAVEGSLKKYKQEAIKWFSKPMPKRGFFSGILPKIKIVDKD